MTLRANEIGADVFSPEETELDKNNLGVTPEEVEHRYSYPELSPGRAVLDVETGALYEIMHRVSGFTDTVEGRQSESEEYFNWKYDNPEGQDWGGIIQHHYVSFAKQQCPEPNEHGEIQAPINRPSENEITDIRPAAFETLALFEDNGQSKPLLLLERPEVTYEEVMPGDTYDILGWYDPSETDEDDRVKPVENIAHGHPEIAGVDYEMQTSMVIPDLGIHIPWNDVSGTTCVQIASSDQADFAVATTNRTRDFHVYKGMASGESRFIIDSPFDAKEDVKALTDARWAPELAGGDGRWATPATSDLLVEMIQSLTNDGWTFTIAADVVSEHAETDVTVNPEEEVTVSLAELFDYTFTEEIEVGTALTVPGVDAEINADSPDSIVEIRPDGDKVTVSDIEESGANHVKALNGEKINFDCPEGNAGIVKSLDWKQARYEPNNEHGFWKLNASEAGNLIQAFIDNDLTVTAPVSILAELGEEETVTEEQRVEVDADAVTGIDSYTNARDDANDALAVEANTESTATCEQIHGTAPSDPDRLTLMALDLSIADTSSQAGMTVDLGGADLAELPESVKDEWRPAADDEDGVYEWYHPHTSARITVEETEGWGTEYDISVKEANESESEHIITLADERMVVLTVITHLKAMTRINA